MKRMLSSSTLLLTPVLMLCGVAAQADEWDKKTVITVDQSIEVPGAVLPAGTYVFKLVESPADRHIVQVFNERENHMFATVIAIPNYRLQPTGKTTISFYEVPAGQPLPVRAWFYPGDNFGQEFVYSTEKSQQLTSTTVTTAATPAPAPVPEPQQLAAAPAPQPEPEPAPVAEPAPSPAAEPAPAPVQVASNEPSPAAMSVSQEAPVMPQTASTIPILMAVGLLSIVAAAGLGVFAKRMS